MSELQAAHYEMVNDFHLTDKTADEVEAWATALLDQVLDTDGIIEADIEATLSTGDVELTMTIEADSGDDAMERGISIVRMCLRIVEGDDSHWGHPVTSDGSRRVSVLPISA